MSWKLEIGHAFHGAGSPGATGLAAHGDHPALISRNTTITYTELAARADAIADELQRLGAGEGTTVALISSGRAHDEPVGLAGILGGSAVAVPLDATAPPARLAGIAQARHCRAIVMDAGAQGTADAMDELGAGLARVVLEPDGRIASTSLAGREPEWLKQREKAIQPGAAGQPGGSSFAPGEAGGLDSSAGMACILHTSGSTGTPKPVPITWAGLDAFTGWMIDLVRLSSVDRVLRIAELIFDLSWFDHLATWRAGAALLTMSRRELAAGRAFNEALAALQPSIIYGVPSLFMKLVAALPAKGDAADAPTIAADPRVVFFAGEVFPLRELANFAARVPGAELFNLYGPTETNVCTYHRVDRAALDGTRETPIGLACPYASCNLVGEENGAIIEGPGTGELVVEGPTTVGGGPYATRDRVARGEDGLFYFRGRIDRMVKVRGYRVEPGEVEAALASHPAVRHAAIVVHDDPRLGKTLRAFVALRQTPAGDERSGGGEVGAPAGAATGAGANAPPAGTATGAGANAPPAEAAVGERDFRMFLADRLPPYMVPDRIFTLDELPLTPTGKVDYQALARQSAGKQGA
jgi:acyl-CoA synthetase (AMP-forming)/AMP-acid ligase II